MMMRLLVLLALFGAPAVVLAQPNALSEKVTRDYREGYYAYDLARMTNRDIPGFSRDLVWEENILRIRVMHHWYAEPIEKHLDWVQQQDWTGEYKAMLFRGENGAEKPLMTTRLRGSTGICVSQIEAHSTFQDPYSERTNLGIAGTAQIG